MESEIEQYGPAINAARKISPAGNLPLSFQGMAIAAPWVLVMAHRSSDSERRMKVAYFWNFFTICLHKRGRKASIATE
jgi:hypothetical protein